MTFKMPLISQNSEVEGPTQIHPLQRRNKKIDVNGKEPKEFMVLTDDSEFVALTDSSIIKEVTNGEVREKN